MKYNRYIQQLVLSLAPSLWRRLYLGPARPCFKAPWCNAYNMYKYYVS